MKKILSLLTLSVIISSAFAGGDDPKPKKPEQRRVRIRPQIQQEEQTTQVVERYEVVPVLVWGIRYYSCVNPYTGCVYHQPVQEWFVQYVKVYVGNEIIYNNVVRPIQRENVRNYQNNQGVRDYRDFSQDDQFYHP